MPRGLIHFYRASGNEGDAGLYEPLLQHGMELRLYCSGQALQRALRTPSAIANPSLVLLGGSAAACFQAAGLVRSVNASVAIVALLAQSGDRSVAQALSVGIDACWPLEAPATQVVPALIRLIGKPAVPSAQFSRSPQAFEWKLTSRLGVLHTPGGGRISLTTAERALVNALLRAPGQRLNHAQLMQAVRGSPCLAGGPTIADWPSSDTDGSGSNTDGSGSSTEAPSSNSDARRLSVLLSRLRRKFDAAGHTMPIRSLRGQGYELCADLGHCPDTVNAGVAPS